MRQSAPYLSLYSWVPMRLGQFCNAANIRVHCPSTPVYKADSVQPRFKATPAWPSIPNNNNAAARCNKHQLTARYALTLNSSRCTTQTISRQTFECSARTLQTRSREKSLVWTNICAGRMRLRRQTTVIDIFGGTNCRQGIVKTDTKKAWSVSCA